MYSTRRWYKINSLTKWPTIAPFRSSSFDRNKQYSNRKTDAYGKKGNGNLPKGTVYLRRMDSVSTEQPATLALHTSGKNYLFNCCEGSSQSFGSAGMSSGRVAHVFLTQRNWSCFAGINALQTSMGASTGSFPTYYGPNDLYHSIEQMSNMTAVGVFCQKNLTREIVDPTDYVEDSDFCFHKIHIKNEHYPDREVFAYLCRMKPWQGAITANRMFELDASQEAISRLIAGESFHLDDGRFVTPADIRQPDRQERRFLVLDIPTTAYFKDLISNERFRELLESNEANNLDFIAHLSPMPIYRTRDYQNFIQSFNARRHFLFNGHFHSMHHKHDIQAILHTIDEDIHPLLRMGLSPGVCEVDLNKEIDHSNNEITDCRKVTLHKGGDDGPTMFDETKEIVNDRIAHIPRTTTFEGKKVRLEDAKYPHIVFLGTSSGVPSHFRNTTSILVNISEKVSILLDCGENTCSQINRFYGNQAEIIYKRLKGIFISHLHVDHYLGLVGLLRMQKLLSIKQDCLRVIGPNEQLRDWINHTTKYIELLPTNIKYIFTQSVFAEGLAAEDCRYLGLESFYASYVPHCPFSSAASFTFRYMDENQQQQRFKLTFSGDTVPCKELIELGRDSTLLIHEATFQDELHERAKLTNHSTVSGAINQGQLMNAKYTILTHFSKRYAILPVLPQNLPNNVGIAFDNMQVGCNDLARLNGLIPLYEKAFPQDVKRLRTQNEYYSRKKVWTR